MTPDSPAPAEIPIPPFVAEMAGLFRSMQNNQFLLAGNVGDLFAYGAEYLPAVEVLCRRLESVGRVVVTYDMANGVRCSRMEDLRTWFTRAADRRESWFDSRIAETPIYSLMSLKLLEEIFRVLAKARKDGEPIPGLTLVINHAETFLPDAPLAQMGDVDRQKLAVLTDWLQRTEFVESPDQVILVAGAATAMHAGLRNLPRMALVPVPRPDKAAREAFVAHMQAKYPGVKLEGPLDELTAGMTLTAIQGMFMQAAFSGRPLDSKIALEALNRLLTSELDDKIEIVRPRHTMEDVVGATALKGELKRIRALLETRDPAVAPTGILVAGPNGVGKTFVFEAWANELGRSVIVLKNMRGMYFGQTEQIFERLRGVLEALGNVIVFVDEADTVFGKPGRDTHETESRLFGAVIRMMGDPKNRGRILWILLTARPDNLAPDMKRSGRAGLHLPVFDPEGEDRRAYVQSILKRAKVEADEASVKAVEAATAHLSPADFNEVLVELRAERALTGKELTAADAVEVTKRLLPGQIAAQRRLQTLQAYMECSRASLLPPSLASYPREKAELEIEELRMRLRV